MSPQSSPHKRNPSSEPGASVGDEGSIAREDLSKVPRIYAPRKRPLRRWFARFVMAIAGWTLETPPPDLKKMVIVAAPHTYWWDGFWMKAFSWAFALPLSWLVKSSTTRGPLGWLIRRTGGVPVERSSPQGLVQQLVNEFRERDELVLVIAPEGTRARREFWKSGFYHVAHKAGVPICLSYLDYGRTAVGCGPVFYTTGDITADMNKIREFYSKMRGKIHENFTEPRLREEVELSAVEGGEAPVESAPEKS